MRLDLYLKKTRLVRQRSLAKRLCDAGEVQLNDVDAKPSHIVVPGDLVQVTLQKNIVVIRVLELPKGNVAKNQVAQFLEVLDQKDVPDSKLFGPADLD